MQNRLHTVSLRRVRARASRSRAGVLVLAAALVATLAGCEPYVEGNGVLSEQPRDVPAFTGLSLTDGIQAVVTVGAGQSVVVRGDGNVLDNVETLVEDHAPHGRILIIRAAKKYTSTNALQVVVSAPTFDYVQAGEASPLAVSGAGADLFTVEAADGSIVSLAGTGGLRLALSLAGGQHGGARLDARGYPVTQAEVTLSAGAFASLDASASVVGTVSGAGSRVENAGAGACAVTTSDGAQAVCAAP